MLLSRFIFLLHCLKSSYVPMQCILFVVISLKGRPGMSDVSPLSGISGLSFDSTLLSSLLFFCLVLLLVVSHLFVPAGPFCPEGGRGCLMSPPCLESQGCHLIPLCYLLSCSSPWSCYPFCLIVFCLLALSSKLFPENSSIFFVKR